MLLRKLFRWIRSGHSEIGAEGANIPFCCGSSLLGSLEALAKIYAKKPLASAGRSRVLRSTTGYGGISSVCTDQSEDPACVDVAPLEVASADCSSATYSRKFSKTSFASHALR